MCIRDRCSAGRPSRWALAHISSSIFFLASSQLSQIGCLPYFHTWCGLSANLGCRFETCCRRLAENTGHKKSPKNCHVGTIAQLRRAISSQLRHVSTIGKKLVKQQCLPTCPHNMVNFSPLAAEILSLVWSTPANFNGFASWQRYCTASSSGRQPKFAALNRGRHLCSAGRPSRWALAHILVYSLNYIYFALRKVVLPQTN